MNRVAIGQYYAANSSVHRLDARTKVLLAILYIVATFLCKSVYAFALMLLSGVFVILLAKIPARTILKALKPIFFITFLTAFINLFWTTGETALVEWWIIKIYPEGIYNAVFMATRIVVLVVGTSVFLTYTTTPIQLTDAIERLLYPLKKIKVPVHEFAMMMSIALRFVPTLVEETERIIAAQKARGADFESGNLIKRAKALIPILIPLFVSSFRRADELATAMECRCYHGGEGRTKMTITHLRFADFAALFFILLFGVAIVCINIFASGYGYSLG